LALTIEYSFGLRELARLRLSREGVVAGAGGDDSAASGAVELDVMEGAVPFEVLRFVDEAILAAQVGIDVAEIVPDGLAALIKENDAPGLGG